jgi:subtilisin family serine protease
MFQGHLFRRVWRARAARVVAAVAVLGLVMPAAQAALPALPGERYIVMLDPAAGEAKAVAQEQARRAGGSVDEVFGAVKGYTTTLPPAQLDAIRRDRRTRLVVKDDVVRVMDAVPVNQSGAPFGVDRVDQPDLPVNGTFAANHDGDGVTVYVIDTGIRASHAEFGGRASVGADFVRDGRNGVDCDGHGTHVAGIIGGKTYGVAKKVKLVAIRALDCTGSGTASRLIAALNWVAANRAPNSVANISLGGATNAALDAAVTAAVGQGVAVTVAAGNGSLLFGGTSACTVSPARVATPGVMTIGATDTRDARASFSNYGPCVDWFAPGVGIKSAWRTSDTATKTLSGTSMAAPFTAGVAALYLDAHPGASPAGVEAALLALSQDSAVVRNSKTAVEHSHLVFTGGAASGL